MIKCKHGDKLINCYEYIGKGEQAVDRISELKEYSGQHKLLCCDENCNQPVQFCHGEDKGSYFRHFPGHKNKCEYSEYSKKRNKYNELKALLYDALKTRELDVVIDKKLLPHHYTDLAVKFPDGNIVAIELTDRRPSGLKWKRLHEGYRTSGIYDLWILQVEPSKAVELVDMYFTDMLNVAQSNQKCAIYFDTENKEIHIKKLLKLCKKDFINANKNVLYNENGNIEIYVDMPELIHDKSFENTLDIKDFEFDSQGNICGKYLEILYMSVHSVLEKYAIDEKRVMKRCQEEKADREKRRELEQAEKKHKEAMIKKFIQDSNISVHTEKKHHEQEVFQIQISFDDVIQVCRQILKNNGINIDESKFDRFIRDNENWLRKNADVEQSKIIVAKYKVS